MINNIVFILFVFFQRAKCVQPSLIAGGPRLLITPPSEVRFASTVGAVLNCLSEGSPTPSTTWIRGDGSRFSPNPSLVNILQNNSIVFEPFSPERYRADAHAVTVRCSASNMFGTVISSPITIQAVISQEYSIRVESYEVHVGGTGYLRCVVPHHLTPYVMPIAWETPSKTIYPTLNPDGRFHMIGQEDLLLVNSVTMADQSVPFTCTVLDLLTNVKRTSLPQKINVIDVPSMSRPSILNKMESFTLKEGLMEALACVASGTPTPTVRWSTYRSNSNLVGSYNYQYDYNVGQGSQHNPTYQVTQSAAFEGSAVILLNSENIQGGEIYVCTANNSLGIDQMSVEIKIERQLKVSVSPPNIEVKLGGSATFTCNIAGQNPTITWYKNGSPVVATGRVIHSGLQLLISSVTHEDSGMYQCLAEISRLSSQSVREGTAQLVIGESRPILVYQFIEQTVQPGPPVSLRCKATGHPLPTISWTKNGQLLPLNGRIMLRDHSSGRGEAISQVNISSTIVEDGGTYKCTAKNSAGEDFHEANLNVYGPPMARQVGPINAVADKALKLFCPVSGFPLTTYSWSKDGVSVGADGLGRGVTGDGHLVIESVRQTNDAGVYTCRAANREGNSATGSVQVSVLVGPKISPFTSVESVVEGERKTLMCTVSKGDLPLILRWLKNGSPISPQSPLAPGSPLTMGAANDVSVMNLNAFNSVLSIDRVNEDHMATYTCEAQNTAATTSVSVSLKVNVPPRIEPLSFPDGLVEGMRTRVMCGVSQGDQPLSLTWLKDGRPLPILAGSPNTQVTVIDAFSSVLTITSLKALHAGHYACEASNSADTVRAEALLDIYVPPSWIFEPSDANVLKGHLIRVNCLAKGIPQPSITWKKKVDGSSTVSDGYRKVVDVRPRVLQEEDGSLLITRAELTHGGTYLCRASNNVSHIDKTIKISVKTPPFFTSKEIPVNSRRGETAILECRAKGDPPPIVTWLYKKHPIQINHRFRDAVTVGPSDDVLATLSISDVTASDNGQYVCFATNELGRNSQNILLNIHEPPSAPRGLRISTVESRSVKVRFDLDDPKPSSYILQYRKEGQVWHESSELLINPTEVEAGVQVPKLMPSTRYYIRVTAVNNLGRSPPSLELPVTTGLEKPNVAPNDVQLEAVSSQEIKVIWSPLSGERTPGTIHGYYVGHGDISDRLGLGQDFKYNFTTVEVSADVDIANTEGKRNWSLVVQNLVPFQEYQFVVQAFNSEGAGPLSTPKIISTLEDVPGGPPLDARCAVVSKDTLRLSWKPPEPKFRHGIVRGYRIEYDKYNGYEDTIRYTQVSTQTTVISGLEPATNYTIRINGFTSAGNGPSTSSITCGTDEDVPGRPDGVRGVVSGPGKFIVSWGPPLVRGGVITSYEVTWRVVGSRFDVGSGRNGVSTVAGNVNWVQIEGVMGTLVEVEVAASTKMGKGSGTTARVTLTNQIPAAIYSIGGTKITHRGEDVRLPCGYVGEQEPTLNWKYQEQPILGSSRININRDGTLYLQNLVRSDSGNYTCSVANLYGADYITYLLLVIVPPEPPLVLASSTSPDTAQIQWSKLDSGGAPVTSFDLNYRKDDGIWIKTSLHRHTYTYTIKNLQCGTKYHIFVIANNVVGSSPPSKTAVVKTLGNPPLAPDQEHFIRVNATYASVHPRTWVAEACPILQMNLEYRRFGQLHWIQVASGATNERLVQVSGLDPSTSYILRATAVSSAGSTTQSYHFTTLNMFGDAPRNWPGMMSGQWLSLRVLLPLLTSAVALASSIGLVCYCVRKKRLLPASSSRALQEEEGREKGSESKFNMAQREQYYATIRKVPQRDSQSDVPENAEDIYPYATFQLPDQQSEHDIPMYSIYHGRNNQKQEGYSKGDQQQHRRRRSRSRSRNRSRGKSIGGDSENYEVMTLASDTETVIDDYETEQGGISSRTESSNQLDDVSSMREHKFIYARSGEGLAQSCPIAKETVCETKNKQSVPTKVPQIEGGSCGDTIYGGGPLRKGQVPILQQRIHHNLLYHAESSTSPESSPTKERKSFPRRGKPRPKSGCGDQENSNSISSAVSTDSISNSQHPRKSHINKHFNQGIMIGKGKFAEETQSKNSAPQNSLQVASFRNPNQSPLTLMGDISSQVAAVAKRSNASKKRQGPAGSAIAGGHGSRGSLDDLEISETECDRALVPPPRSYSDARYIRNQRKLQDKKISEEGVNKNKQNSSKGSSGKEKDYSLAF